MIFVMVVLGGATRLTRSGLSIAEWRLVEGTLPPLGQSQWQELFDRYRETPEYKGVNAGMDLAGFKEIFWLEYLHRLWGRVIFFFSFVPLLWYLGKRTARAGIDKHLLWRLALVPPLVALNGVLGWLMVKSGLVDIPRVSPYRLAAHLGLAISIYGYIVWLALGLLYPTPQNPASPALRRFGIGITALVFVTILAGAFVAGTHAGFAFNTFPLMNGRIVPEGALALQPWWVNFFENIALVQFNHRLLAYSVLIAVGVYWWRARHAALAPQARIAAHLLPLAAIAQIALGITTLLLVVPVSLGTAHQAGALVVFTVSLYLNHALRERT